ncbi:unnamed protein product [Polarella glacialis]|uniref:Uncharacterized protein n=1 Tax=Polarella glacialis TaxID=89957 RepID=A0A813FJ85_POLGL|nr:unnamed protein product [Polarella glacialis]
MRELQVWIREIVDAWRCLALGVASARLHSQLLLQKVHHASLCGGFERLSDLGQRQALLLEIAHAWLCQVLSDKAERSCDKAAAGVAVGFARARSIAEACRVRLVSARQDEVKLRAFLALHSAARESTREEKLRAAGAEQMDEILWRANHRTRNAVLGAMEGDAIAFQRSAWLAWVAALQIARQIRSFEALEGRLSGVQHHCCVVLGRLSDFGNRRMTASRALCSWIRGTRNHIAERRLLLQKERLAVWRANFLQSASRHIEEAAGELEVWFCWQAWCRVVLASDRLRAEDAVDSRAAKRQQQLLRLRLLAIDTLVQAHQSFLLRACLAAWRRLRALQRAVLDSGELSRLQATAARLRFARNSGIERLADHLQELGRSTWLTLVWLVWRKLRQENFLFQELDAVQQLLPQLQAEWSRQQTLQMQQEWADQQAFERLQRERLEEHQLLQSQTHLRPEEQQLLRRYPSQACAQPEQQCHAASGMQVATSQSLLQGVTTSQKASAALGRAPAPGVRAGAWRLPEPQAVSWHFNDVAPAAYRLPLGELLA